MSFDANHIGFVLGSYAISAIVIIGLIAIHMLRARRHDRRLGELESQGAPRRRSQEAAPK